MNWQKRRIETLFSTFVSWPLWYIQIFRIFSKTPKMRYYCIQISSNDQIEVSMMHIPSATKKKQLFADVLHEVFLKILQKNFRKTPVTESLLIKLHAAKQTPAKVLSCEVLRNFKDMFFVQCLRVTVPAKRSTFYIYSTNEDSHSIFFFFFWFSLQTTLLSWIITSTIWSE